MAWVEAAKLAAADLPPQKQIDQVIDYAKRKAKPRFYADENFPVLATGLLRRYGGKVLTAQEARLIGYPDESQAAYALRKKRILVTRDRDFLDDRRFPLIRCPAIFVFDFGAGSEQEIRLAFRCLGSVYSTPQFFDKWWKIDATPHGWIERARYLDGNTSRRRMRVHAGMLEEWV